MLASDLASRALTRLNEDAGNPAFWTTSEALAAVNLAQRLFAFLTLCLESTYQMPVRPGGRFFRMLSVLPDYIMPLRINLAADQEAGASSTFDTAEFGGAMLNDEQYQGLPVIAYPKLYPARLTDLGLRNAAWLSATGLPKRYGHLKNDLLFIDQSPTTPGTQMLITYARMPKTMAAGDALEVPVTDQPSLIDLAVLVMRVKEGGQELKKAAQHHLPRFVAAVKLRAAEVRARSLAQRYDVAPPELERFDLSRLLKFRADLPPNRQQEGPSV